MNIYAVVILATLLLGYILNLVSSLLNLRALAAEVPQELEGIFDAEAYAKSQEYTRVRTRFGLVSETATLAAMLIFWFLGGFNWVDQLVRQLELGTVATGLLYTISLAAAKIVFDLPFSLYSTFVIEERFGFNKTTWITFLLDRVKGLVIAAALGVPLLAALLYLLEHVPQAWIYCWLLTVAFLIVVQLIFPVWILPLFFKMEPIEEGSLKDAILAYARSVAFPIHNIFVIDGSKRSTKSNAFFTGLGRNKRLALFDTLIDQHTIPELVAVVAHEVGHYKRKHILKGLAIGVLHAGVMFFLLSIFISNKGLADAFYMEHVSVYAGLIFFSMLYAPIELLLSIALQAFSRKNEYEADRYAATTIEDPEEMANALKKLSRDNLVNLTPHPFHVFLQYSHPPIRDRIRAIRRVATEVA